MRWPRKSDFWFSWSTHRLFDFAKIAKSVKIAIFYRKNAIFAHFRESKNVKGPQKWASTWDQRQLTLQGVCKPATPIFGHFCQKSSRTPEKWTYDPTFWPKSVHQSAKMVYFWAKFDPQMTPKKGLNPSLKKFLRPHFMGSGRSPNPQKLQIFAKIAKIAISRPQGWGPPGFQPWSLWTPGRVVQGPRGRIWPLHFRRGIPRLKWRVSPAFYSPGNPVETPAKVSDQAQEGRNSRPVKGSRIPPKMAKNRLLKSTMTSKFLDVKNRLCRFLRQKSRKKSIFVPR